MSGTGRVAPGCGPTDPDGVQPPEGRDVIALPVTALEWDEWFVIHPQDVEVVRLTVTDEVIAYRVRKSVFS